VDARHQPRVLGIVVVRLRAQHGEGDGDGDGNVNKHAWLGWRMIRLESKPWHLAEKLARSEAFIVGMVSGRGWCFGPTDEVGGETQTSRSWRPASSLSALSGLGTISRHLIVMRMCVRSSSGFQSRLSVLTQISPSFATFGWKIFVMKYPLGGACGKSVPRTSRRRNLPPSYGVSAGVETSFRLLVRLSAFRHLVSFLTGNG
jgi:hypothetical protein